MIHLGVYKYQDYKCGLLDPHQKWLWIIKRRYLRLLVLRGAINK